MAPPPRKQRRKLSLLQLLPNLLTVVAIIAGLTAIRYAVQGAYGISVALIVLAAALDGIDGRLARLLNSETEIGAELDSLADFLNFGVAPALTIYFWALQDTRGTGWSAVLIYAISCVLRLARFNVDSRGEATKPQNGFFTGIPSPMGALLVMLPLYLAHTHPDVLRLPPLAIGGWMVLVGLLMISRLPTPSLKSAMIYAEYVKFAVVGFAALMAALLTYPWATLVAIDLAYLVGLVWAWRQARKTAD
jgi:CDP-diacylglycerol--serine O-phosphatidyltransferase